VKYSDELLVAVALAVASCLFAGVSIGCFIEAWSGKTFPAATSVLAGVSFTTGLLSTTTGIGSLIFATVWLGSNPPEAAEHRAAEADARSDEEP
jgi:hypothetical protein